MKRAFLSTSMLVALVVGAVFGGLTPPAPSPAAAAAGSAGEPPLGGRPNVLLVITDDQPYRGSLKRMGQLRALEAVRFSRAYTNDPLCCPSRATMLTGLYDHHTNVTHNSNGHRLDDSETIATAAQEAGYRTALFGKYLNEYPWDRGPGYVPPGWDEWHAFVTEGYYDYTLNENGTPVDYGDSPEDYSTDVLADKLDSFIAEPSEQPFFAVLSPRAAHSQLVPAPEYDGKFANAPVRLPPNFNRRSDGAPRWWWRRPRVDRAAVLRRIRDQWETLESVDDAIGQAVSTLEASERMDDTVIIFISDNGMGLGSHRWLRKSCAYEECIRIPFLISIPGVEERSEDALVSNVDLAPTIAELAGASLPNADGTSLVDVVEGDERSLHRPVLLHHVKEAASGWAPTYWGIRTGNWKLVQYRSGDEELYRLGGRNPQELENLAADPDMRQRSNGLMQRLRALRDG